MGVACPLSGACEGDMLQTINISDLKLRCQVLQQIKDDLGRHARHRRAPTAGGGFLAGGSR